MYWQTGRRLLQLKAAGTADELTYTVDWHLTYTRDSRDCMHRCVCKRADKRPEQPRMPDTQFENSQNS